MKARIWTPWRKQLPLTLLVLTVLAFSAAVPSAGSNVKYGFHMVLALLARIEGHIAKETSGHWDQVVHTVSCMLIFTSTCCWSSLAWTRSAQAKAKDLLVLNCMGLFCVGQCLVIKQAYIAIAEVVVDPNYMRSWNAFGQKIQWTFARLFNQKYLLNVAKPTKSPAPLSALQIPSSNILRTQI